MTYWYIHLMHSELNWIFTSVVHIICSAYHITAYCIRVPANESQNLQFSFIFLLAIFHCVYVMLTYH